MKRRLGAVLATVALALAAVVTVAAPASAHNRILESVPGDGSTLTELPARFSLTTDQPLLVVGGSTAGFVLDVQDAAGRHYGDGCIRVVDQTMSTAAALGKPGDYTVRWQMVSADGHTVSDQFRFTWAPSAATTPSRGFDAAQRCGRATASAGESAAPSAGGAGRGASASIGDVLWIGGAVLIVLVAAGVLLVVLTRRKPRGGETAG